MKKKFLAILLAVLLAVSAVPMPVMAEDEAPVVYGTPGVDYVEGEAIVCVNGGMAALKGRGRSVSYEMENLMDVKNQPQADARARSAVAVPEMETQSLVLVKGGETTALIEALQENPAVEYAEPNYIMTAYGAEGTTPTDPYYTKKAQWGLKNRMNEAGTAIPSYDANVASAWDQAAGTVSPDKKGEPVVAVVDSGVDYTHPDLKDRMWSEGKNIPELTAMGGGAHGYNTCAQEPSDDPMDVDSGHGTHCAGVIGAQWNDEGGAGVSSNPDLKIMAVRFLSDTPGHGTMDGAIKGFAYIQKAMEKDVNVVAVSNSWGPSNYNGLQLRSISTAANVLGEKGAAVLFAAGNSGTNNDANTSSGMSSPYVVTVGALESEGHPASFSCYGQRTVDVFAPGTYILGPTSTFENPAMGMPNQYLPQLMQPEESLYYEDFEDADSSITLKLLDQNGEEVKGVEQVSTPGYASEKGLGIPLKEIPMDEGFYIEMTMKSDALKTMEIKDNESLYFALQGGGEELQYGSYFLIQYKDKADGSWKILETTKKSGEKHVPAHLMLDDYRWNQSSQELLENDFLEGNDGTVTLRLAPVTKRKGTAEDVFRIDNIGFGKSTIPYYYASGTSMATPMVSGIAALLGTKADAEGNRLYDTKEVIARIKGGVNREGAASNGLADKSVSQGTIDAAAAFDDDQVVPVLNDLTVSGTAATLKGYFFGEKGTITIGDKEAEVTNWTEDEITLALPADVEGLQEVKVTTSAGRYGRNFFKITPDTIGYTPLKAPNFKYGDTWGYDLTSADAIPINIAAAGNNIIYQGIIIDTMEPFMEIYDIDKGTWSKFSDKLGVDLKDVGDIRYMTGGATKIYMACVDKQSKWFLGVYDTVKETFTKTPTEINGTESLVVYKEQLLAVGGMDDSGSFLKTVKIVDPDTGKVMGSLPELPEGRNGVEVFAIGDTLILYGGVDKAKLCTDTMTFDGTGWTMNEATFTIDMDPMQTKSTAIAPVNKGLIAVGPVKNLGQDTMVDTWSFDKASDTWSGRADVLYSQIKTVNNIGVSHKGQCYVLSTTGDKAESLIFRALPVEYEGPAKDAKGKGGPGPVPTPTPGPNPTIDPETTREIGKNTKTGIKGEVLPAGLLLAMALAGAAGLGYGVKKKRF
ncbi:MAG: S8 family serine peptidase [Eubacterium sp.]